MVGVAKKEKSILLCVDFRRVNAIAVFNAHPMPRTNQILEQKGKAQYISSINLTKGYWQIPMTEEARRKSAFITPFGLFEFRTMPFGLHTAPATFMRLMDELLNGLNEYADAYFLKNYSLFKGFATLY